MKKITMKQLIIHILANACRESVLISVLLHIARSMMENEPREKIGFSATPPHIFKTVLQNPKLFRVCKRGMSIELCEPALLDKYVQDNEIDDELKAIIQKYVDKFKEPLYHAFIDMHITREHEDFLKAVPVHIDWLVQMVEKHIGFNSNDYHLARNEHDLENFTLMSDFYRLLSRYCEDNLIPCVDNTNESYVVYWGEPDNMKYVVIHKLTEKDVTYYRAIQSGPMQYSVDYCNIAFGVQDEHFDRKQKELANIKQILTDAKSHGIPYKSLKGILDDLYDIYPDLHES